jgi:Spy/CpxP family protein refolding chaperone
MKRPAILLAALAAGSLAFADPPAGPSSAMTRGGPPIERLTQDLGLDANQVAQVKAIFEQQHAKMEAERALSDSSGTRPSREDMHARHEQMNAELRAQLANVLTPEQLARFDALPKRQRTGGPPGQGQPPAQ